MWRQHLGINIALTQPETKVRFDTVQEMRHQIALGEWIGDYLDPTALLDQFRRNSTSRSTGWSKDEYDRLLGQADVTPDQTLRYELMQRAEALMLAEVPVVPLYHSQTTVLRHPAVKGWHDNVLLLYALKSVYLEN
jgi:oligopeptide transport system substrate-binding protein